MCIRDSICDAVAQAVRRSKSAPTWCGEVLGEKLTDELRKWYELEQDSMTMTTTTRWRARRCRGLSRWRARPASKMHTRADAGRSS
eukprot:10941342-Karenia_brevis.AAC.1